ncbi:rod shape-determining protein [Acidobacteria bacterium AH-259-L09]|nr:rod shape-determining protein [Acidobacteria bacterium AH-259-L09]
MRLKNETGLPVFLAEDPLSSVVMGTAKMLSDMPLLKTVSST